MRARWRRDEQRRAPTPGCRRSVPRPRPRQRQRREPPHPPHPRAQGDARRRSGCALRSRDPGVVAGGEAQPRALSRGLHASAHGRRVRSSKITDCDLSEEGPGTAPQVPALRLHRTGGRDAVERPPQRATRAGQRRDHAGLRAPARDSVVARRSGPQAGGAREEVRRPVQGGIRRDPGAHDAACGAEPVSADNR
jgi:hypothetical protein